MTHDDTSRDMSVPEYNKWLTKVTDGDPMRVLHNVEHRKLVVLITCLVHEVRRLSAAGSSYDSMVSLCDAKSVECNRWEHAWSELSVAYHELEKRMKEINKLSKE